MIAILFIVIIMINMITITMIIIMIIIQGVWDLLEATDAVPTLCPAAPTPLGDQLIMILTKRL